jgi:hypothetical protein
MKDLEALSSSLAVLSRILLDQDQIKVVSVSGNGVIKVVFDSEKVSVGDIFLKEGIEGIIEGSHSFMEGDPRSNSIFITIKP